MKKILTRSPEEYKKALQLFTISGLPLSRNMTVEEFAKVYKWEEGSSSVGISSTNKYITAFICCGREYFITFDDTKELGELVKELLNYKKAETIHDVGKYEAIVSQDSIKVGCTEISFDKFDEIAAAVERMRKN